MSDSGSGDLSLRIGEVEREVREVHAGLAAGKRTRLIVLLLLIAFSIGIGWMFYSLYQRVTSKQFTDGLTEAAQKHMEANQQVYSAEVQKLVDTSTPVLTKAFMEQTQKDMPKYTAALDSQRQELMDNLRPQLEELINKKYAEILEGYSEILIEEFPEAKDPEVQDRIMKSMEVAVDGLVKEYYVDQFKSQMEEMYASWEDFPVADKPQAGEAELSDQLIGFLLEIVTVKLANPSGEVAL